MSVIQITNTVLTPGWKPPRRFHAMISVIGLLLAQRVIIDINSSCLSTCWTKTHTKTDGEQSFAHAVQIYSSIFQYSLNGDALTLHPLLHNDQCIRAVLKRPTVMGILF